MISFTVSSEEVTHTTPYERRGKKTFYCKDADLNQQPDGSFKIPDLPVPARDADLAHTKDTRRTFMYDEDIDAFWEQ